MNTTPTSRVIGAFLVGFALVAGAYVASNVSSSGSRQPNTVTSGVEKAPLRVPIPVTDNDGNGVEDWRDDFFVAAPAIATSTEEQVSYIPPDTLTGQLGINFIEDIVRFRNSGGSVDDTEVITQTIESLQNETAVTIFDTVDITILPTATPRDIRTYGNAVANAFLEHNQTDLDYELYILQDMVNRGDTSRLAELEELAEVNRVTRDALLAVPVPVSFAKTHLDLVNTIHALHSDIDAMSRTFTDPAFALLRLKRYEDNVLGLALALENMYRALLPYEAAFEPTDPVVYFAQFNPAVSQVNRLRI